MLDASPLMLRDLSRHFRGRLAQIMEDSLDTCQRVDVSYRQAIAMVIGHCLSLSAMAAVEDGTSKEEFLHACSETYDLMKKAQK